MARINLLFTAFLSTLIIFSACDNTQKEKPGKSSKNDKNVILIEAENHHDKHGKIETITRDQNVIISLNEEGWLAFDADVKVAGRYKVEIHAAKAEATQPVIWIEDYYDNEDDRTYNITGNITLDQAGDQLFTYNRVGTPLNIGVHKMKIHTNKPVKIDWIRFTLIRKHVETPKSMVQQTEGDEWKVVWADEFDGNHIDTTKWTYDIGNWGWGNFEWQYYTENREENARIEDGNLIIEARKDDMGQRYTSARLTTRGKISFQYGKIEFRAKVPPAKGNWAAGWTLGDDYVDELSWPYCGEIDILESVGFEMDNKTGNGIAHASAHSGAYYFKLGNQPTATTEVENMNNKFHTYAVEWTPEYIKAFVDGDHYFTYDDNSTELSWPFDKPHNIILNLAMGGGWGGAQGMNDTVTSQKMIIDYVRVYERQ